MSSSGYLHDEATRYMARVRRTTLYLRRFRDRIWKWARKYCTPGGKTVQSTSKEAIPV